jgi:hypothetical protein
LIGVDPLEVIAASELTTEKSPNAANSGALLLNTPKPPAPCWQ